VANKKFLASEITAEKIYHERRNFLKKLGLASATLGFSPALSFANMTDVKKIPHNIKDNLTSYKDVTSYNNFYEFGLQKSSPKANAHKMKIDPWAVEISGEIEKNKTYALEDLVKLASLEERIYRLRCVEGWSMVIPWVGFSLSVLLKKLTLSSRAQYVVFETLYRPNEMEGQKSRVLDWPYIEALRIDEAMHPLTMLCFGVYGKVLPNQNGAPVRLVIPWKYGFKSIKSIVKIKFVETMPQTTWALSSPKEYGFYANVNPTVDHPRWTQATERRIGDSILAKRRKTEFLNGYADEVGYLYSGLDLKKNF